MGYSARVWVGIALAVAARPTLWWAALRQCARLARCGWFRRFPFLPVPDRGVVGFRLATAYGTEGVPSGADVVRYLRWCAARR